MIDTLIAARLGPRPGRGAWVLRVVRRVALLGVVGLALGVGSSFLPLSYEDPALDATDDLRIVTLNIAHGRGLAAYQGLVPRGRIEHNLHAIGAFLSEVDADVVALQEVDSDASWSGNFDHLAELARASGYPHSAVGVNNRNPGGYRLEYGNAVLSRHPIVYRENHPFGSARLGEKGLLYVEIARGSEVVPLIVVHLDFRSDARRLEQIEMIATFVRSMSMRRPEAGPPIICGDFNSELADGPFVALLARLPDHSPAVGVCPRNTPTFPVWWPEETIDYIVLPGNLRATRCQVLSATLSDHLPVMVEVTSR